MNKSETQKYVKELQDKIAKLERECYELEKSRMEWMDNAVNFSRKCEELEAQMAKIQVLSDQHQSDCIRINQLNVALDVMTEKYQRLRELKGL